MLRPTCITLILCPNLKPPVPAKKSTEIDKNNQINSIFTSLIYRFERVRNAQGQDSFSLKNRILTRFLGFFYGFI